ncbi:MAG: hypothetical protein LKI58_03295 [Actinomyces sp.]|nr:hypothetical protein [Actinomyces sp.]MCI1641063.1 hypothetical protein [Actinomyces sp.]MCI1661431.1 hypothetical protein [Actinomyces sp.]MCI1690439.1 hypothetical protein [Actinomyces sp.]MCI1787080.1 hypothetical protein [Actinomyces sp.]MCI1829354.1 hypothetical protein [Actinomyces sp.]
MSPAGWAALTAVILVVLVAGWYAVQLARRLDRLHWRLLSTRDALDRLTVRRAADARLLAASGLLDAEPARALTDAATTCLMADEAVFVNDDLDRRRDGLRGVAYDERSVAERNERESALSRALRACLTPQARDRVSADPEGSRLLESLDMACYRVQLARSMHNLDVTQVRHLRENAWVRALHLYGRATPPDTIDFDDGASALGPGR